MKEKIYTVPVNDAFAADSECPVCAMFEQLENDAIEYTMGPSYMEDDIRAVTDKKGFCQKHIKKIYEQNNRLSSLRLNSLLISYSCCRNCNYASVHLVADRSVSS